MPSLPIIPTFPNIEASAGLMARAFTHKEPKGQGHRALLLDLDGVKVLTAGDLGRLVALHNRLRASGGRLALCNVGRWAFEVVPLATTAYGRLLCPVPRSGCPPPGR
jgi:hypothetical protein